MAIRSPAVAMHLTYSSPFGQLSWAACGSAAVQTPIPTVKGTPASARTMLTAMRECFMALLVWSARALRRDAVRACVLLCGGGVTYQIPADLRRVEVVADRFELAARCQLENGDDVRLDRRAGRFVHAVPFEFHGSRPAAD